MNLQQLRYLVALGNAPSLTAAAEELGVSQPMLSRALRALERELGASLFRIDGRRLALTDVGRAALVSARAAVRAADQVRVAVRPPEEHLLVVATPRHQWMVGRLLPRLGDLPLRVIDGRDPDDVLRIVAAAAGRAVGIGELGTRPKGLEFVPAGRVEVVLLSPPGTDLPETVRTEHLGALDLALPRGNTDRRRSHGERLLGHQSLRVAVTAESRDVLFPAVLAGRCSTVDARCLVETVPRAEVRSFDPPRLIDMNVARVPGPPSVAVAAFLEAVADPPWW